MCVCNMKGIPYESNPLKDVCVQYVQEIPPWDISGNKNAERQTIWDWKVFKFYSLLWKDRYLMPRPMVRSFHDQITPPPQWSLHDQHLMNASRNVTIVSPSVPKWVKFNHFLNESWNHEYHILYNIVSWVLKDPIWHSSEWQIGSFSSEATIYCKH